VRARGIQGGFNRCAGHIRAVDREAGGVAAPSTADLMLIILGSLPLIYEEYRSCRLVDERVKAGIVSRSWAMCVPFS